MRRWLPFLLVLSFAIFLGTTKGVQTRNLQIDGIITGQSESLAGFNINYWETDERLVGNGGVDWFFTWDSSKFYGGRERGSNSDTSYLFFRIEAPGATFASTAPPDMYFQPTFASLSGINYVGKFQSGMSGGGGKYQYTGSAWGGLTTYPPSTVFYAHPAAWDNMEFSTNWYDFSTTGSFPTAIMGVFYETGSGDSYGQSPSGNPTGLTPTVSMWWDFGTFTSGVAPSANPLPVELVSFIAVTRTGHVELEWSTASELQNYGFDVERRAIGSATWTHVGFVPGGNTSTSSRHYVYIDRSVDPGRYAYRLKQVNNDGTINYSSSLEVEVGLAPKVLALEQNFPNPFNPSTEIGFTVPADGSVRLEVYDIAGRLVRTLFDGAAQAGRRYDVRFDAGDLPSGMYFSRLVLGSENVSRKLVLLK